jgi:hypothetical protein
LSAGAAAADATVNTATTNEAAMSALPISHGRSSILVVIALILSADDGFPPPPSSFRKKRTSSMPLGKLTPLFPLIVMLPSFSYCFTCPSPRVAWASSASLLTLPPSLHRCVVSVIAVDNFLGPIKRSGLTDVMVFGQTTHILYIKTRVSEALKFVSYPTTFNLGVVN